MIQNLLPKRTHFFIHSTKKNPLQNSNQSIQLRPLHTKIVHIFHLRERKKKNATVRELTCSWFFELLCKG